MKHGRGGNRHRDGRPQRPVLDLTPASSDTAAPGAPLEGTEAEPAFGAADPATSSDDTGHVEGAGSASFGSTLEAEARPVASEHAQTEPATLASDAGGEAGAIAAGSRALESEEPALPAATSPPDDALRPAAFTPAEEPPAATVTDAPRPLAAAPPQRRGGFASAALGLLFGLLGGAATAAAGLWYVGLLPPTQPRYPDQVARVGALETEVRTLAARPAPAPDARVGDLGTRLGALEGQLRELAARPQPTPPPPPAPLADEGARAAIGAIEARLDKAEAALAERAVPQAAAPVAPAPSAASEPGAIAALEERMAALAAENKSLSDELGNLGRRLDETAGTAQAARDAAARAAGAASATVAGATEQINALGRRLEGLEASTKTLQAAAAKPDADIDRAARTAAAITAVRGSAERGEPFAAELAAAKAVVPDAKALSTLDAFAASGLPSAATLSRELSAEAAKLRDKAAPPASAGLLDRLEASATKLVRVRPVEGAAQPRPDDPLGALEAAAARNDIPAALAAAERLPPEQRAALEPWMAKARARQSAVDTLQRLSRDSLAALRPATSEAPGR